MYFLFNNEDNSYNCHSETPFPEFMKPGTFEVHVPDFDPTSLKSDITFCAWSPDTNEILDNPYGTFRLNSSEGKQFLIDFFTSNQYLEQRSDPAAYQMMTSFAAMFLDQDTFNTITADGVIDSTEADQIIAELNEISADSNTVYDENGNIVSYVDSDGNTVTV